jgi:hypothetical protein
VAVERADAAVTDRDRIGGCLIDRRLGGKTLPGAAMANKRLPCCPELPRGVLNNRSPGFLRPDSSGHRTIENVSRTHNEQLSPKDASLERR